MKGLGAYKKSTKNHMKKWRKKMYVAESNVLENNIGGIC